MLTKRLLNFDKTNPEQDFGCRFWIWAVAILSTIITSWLFFNQITQLWSNQFWSVSLWAEFVISVRSVCVVVLCCLYLRASLSLFLSVSQRQQRSVPAQLLQSVKVRGGSRETWRGARGVLVRVPGCRLGWQQRAAGGHLKVLEQSYVFLGS